MVMNKVGGFLQRLEFARKYAFGVMCILKDKDGRFPIKGVWLFRGPNVPEQMIKESVDLDLYHMEKADINEMV